MSDSPEECMPACSREEKIAKDGDEEGELSSLKFDTNCSLATLVEKD